MKTFHTFKHVTKNRYRKPVAKVYGTLRGIQFQQVFKTLEAAQAVAMKFNGVVVQL